MNEVADRAKDEKVIGESNLIDRHKGSGCLREELKKSLRGK